MARFVTGDVVVFPYPFSDLSQAKTRPALVLASLSGDDVIVCQITTRDSQDRYAIRLEQSDFTSGHLRQPSNIRPNRLLTVDTSIILYRAGVLSAEKVNRVIDGVIDIIRQK